MVKSRAPGSPSLAGIGALPLALALLCALQLPAAAKSPLACVVKISSAAYHEPQTLRALLDCQNKKLGNAVASYTKRQGQAPSEDTHGQWADRQRAEVRGYLRRHPDRATLQEKSSAAPQAGAGSGKQPDNTDLDALRQSLWAESDEGRKGVTPQMAQDIIRAITAQQGSVSPDMTKLLDAVQKDGAALSDDTVSQLKAAARQANVSGLDLGVKPDIQEFLLKDDGKPAASPGTN